MASVRVVGRREQRRRCVLCHDQLSGKVLRCSSCGTMGHPECLRSLERCPTLGCEGLREKPPEVGAPRGAPPRFVEGWIAERRRLRPRFVARLGPYARILAGGLIGVPGFLIGAAILLAPFVWPSIVGRMLTEPGEDGVAPGIAGMAFRAVMILIGLGCDVMFTLHCLRRVLSFSSVLREVRDLLDRDRPVAMRLRTRSESDGESTSWFAELEGDVGRLTLPLSGALPPGWLQRERPEETVLVYGWPPPGPYLIEFLDGWLALVHPEGSL